MIGVSVADEINGQLNIQSKPLKGLYEEKAKIDVKPSFYLYLCDP
jgi:hypothetical protein